MFPSIRSFLAVSYTLVVLLVIAALGVGIQLLVETRLRSNLDADLQARGRQLTDFILGDPDTDPVRRVSLLAGGTGPGGREGDVTYVRLYDSRGSILPLEGPIPPVPAPTPRQLWRAADGATQTVQQQDGQRFRVLTRRVVLDKEPLVYFQLLRSLEPVERIADQLRNALVAGTLLAAVIAGILAYALAYQALRPFSEIVDDARQIGADRWDLRLPQSYGVDEVSKLAQSFNSLLDRLQKVLDLQRRFVADASHELRTPLTTIRGNVDVLLLDPDLPPDARDALRQVSGESARMARLISNLLLLARADAGQEPPARPVDLHALVLETLRQARSMSSTVGVYLEREDQALVEGDADQLKQVLLNLLDNALKYTPDGGRVALSVYTEGAWAKVEVRDNGIGIAPEELQRIFDRFYRAERTSHRAGGSGLGLSIVSSVVRAHGGRVAVESTPGLGSKFTVWLPLLPAPVSNRTLTSA
jgi:heavy metal sensor kinase